MCHLATLVVFGERSPNVTVNDGLILSAPMLAPMIIKLTSNPFSFSTISGCPEVIRRLEAVP